MVPSMAALVYGCCGYVLFSKPSADSIRSSIRSYCWLTLHDFDKNDIQVSKSELLGSKLPVYIG